MVKKKIYSKPKLTLITRALIYLMSFAVIAVCAILLPEIAREERVENPNTGPAYPFLIGAWVLSLPIFAALYQTYKLVGYIDKNTAFSDLSIKAIKKIKLSAVLFAVMVGLGAITVLVIGRSMDSTEDLTPILSIGFVFTFASSLIATFASVLVRLLQDALNMKNENDLIV